MSTEDAPFPPNSKDCNNVSSLPNIHKMVTANSQNGGPNLSRKASGPASASSSSSMDFVTADVNEILQDARGILTNKERREEHPNERVLDESTTVKVTKTGGDEDPMEVCIF
jgi:hypothetical protein